MEAFSSSRLSAALARIGRGAGGSPAGAPAGAALYAVCNEVPGHLHCTHLIHVLFLFTAVSTSLSRILYCFTRQNHPLPPPAVLHVHSVRSTLSSEMETLGEKKEGTREIGGERRGGGRSAINWRVSRSKPVHATRDCIDF